MNKVWLKAVYECHSFHYRMPETVAISGVNPAMPSPLTVQMAMLASFLRAGDSEKAQWLLEQLPLELRVRPPKGAIVFRSLMRYVRPPKNASNLDKNTGATYKISPHFREFALLQGPLEVYVRCNSEQQVWMVQALENVPYLGAKDSLVSCLEVVPVNEPPGDCAMTAHEANLDQPTDFTVVQLANFATHQDLFPAKKAAEKGLTLERLLPSQRLKNHYRLDAYLVSGEVRSSGNVRIYTR